MEKMPDGTNVFRNSRLEEREAKKFEADRHQRREKLFLKIQEEFEKECLEPGAWSWWLLENRFDWKLICKSVSKEMHRIKKQSQ